MKQEAAANIIMNSLKNQGGKILTNLLVNCMVALLDASADKAVWRETIKFTLTQGSQYIDPLFGVDKVDENYSKIRYFMPRDEVKRLAYCCTTKGIEVIKY